MSGGGGTERLPLRSPALRTGSYTVIIVVVFRGAHPTLPHCPMVFRLGGACRARPVSDLLGPKNRKVRCFLYTPLLHRLDQFDVLFR
jgi:hypothetical protein